MAQSGIKMRGECQEMFTLIKDKYAHGHAIMKIEGDKEIVLVKADDPHTDRTPESSKEYFDKMKDEVLDKDEEPCYILFDISYYRKSGTSKDVVVYIYWCPDDKAPVKKKMIYASTSNTLKKTFTGIRHFECHDEDEFTYEKIAGKLSDQDRA